jgi:hypothetical protein
VGCIEVWGFFKNYELQFFFQKFRASYVKKIIDSGVFEWIITKFEVFFWESMDCKHIFRKLRGSYVQSWTANIFSCKFRGSYVKAWTTNIFSRKFRGSYVKIHGPRSWFLLNGKVFPQNDRCWADPGCPRTWSDSRELVATWLAKNTNKRVALFNLRHLLIVL